MYRIYLFLMMTAFAVSIQAQIVCESATVENVDALVMAGTPAPGEQLTATIMAPEGAVVSLFVGTRDLDQVLATGQRLMVRPTSVFHIVTATADKSNSVTFDAAVPAIASVGDAFYCQACIVQGSTLDLTNRTSIFVTELADATTIQFLTLNPVTSPTTSLSQTLSGTASIPGSTIAIQGAGNNISVVTNRPNGQFSATISLLPDRVNQIYVTETAPSGDLFQPISIQITHDTQPPEVYVDAPIAGQELTESTVTVVGRVADSLSGFAGLQVLVNGQSAIVDPGIGTNGTFELSGVSLGAVGTQTTINVVATDVLGNSTTAPSVTVERIPLVGPQMTILSGDSQTGTVNTELPDPIVVRVTFPDGSAFPNKLVNFTVTHSDGGLSFGAGGSTASSRQVLTDSNGEALVHWTLGSDAGCGNNRIAVTSSGISGFIGFCASSDAGPAEQVNVSAGNEQRAAAGAIAPEGLRVWVSDGLNPVSGVPVVFNVTRGSGLFVDDEGVQVETFTTLTSSTGHATATFALGARPGVNLVRAFAPGATGAASFVLTGLPATADGTTRFSGVVHDNAGRPIGGATCTLEILGTDYGPVLSNGEGQFAFEDLPTSGPAHLHVDGSTAMMLNGSMISNGAFPSLAYELLVVPGAENGLGRPVLLPELRNPPVAYDPVNGNTLTIEGIDGLVFHVAPNSMFIDGAPAPPSTELTLNAVHVDNIPMSIPDGANPQFTWTLQPHGATFDPPIRIEYPNMSGLAPNAVAYFLSFDHDVGAFNIIASGRVTADGALIISEPGDGLATAGWGCNCPPYSATSDCENCVETCQPGSIIGGVVSIADADADQGGTQTFSAVGAFDGGGSKTTICPDGSTTFQLIAPVGLGYSYELTAPDGTVTMGTGSSVTVTNLMCGTYSVTFTAQADRECAPADRVIGPYSWGVPVGKETTISILLGAPPGFSYVNTYLANLDLGELSTQASTGLEISFQEICCPDDTTGYVINASIGLEELEFEVDGEFTVFGPPIDIPFIGEVGVDLELELGGTASLNGTASYDPCNNTLAVGGSGRLEVNVSGGVEIDLTDAIEIDTGLTSGLDIELALESVSDGTFRICVTEAAWTALAAFVEVQVDSFFTGSFMYYYEFVIFDGVTLPTPICTAPIDLTSYLP